MRTTLFSLIALLLMVSPAVAQENKAQDQTSTSTIEKPKSEVDRMLEDAANRGETIVGTCISEDCAKDSKISQGVQAGRILRMPKPIYPAIAVAARAEGEVEVRLIIDEQGMVIAAAAISGHPLLQAASVSAARDAEFAPTLLNGKPVKVTGVIKYSFVQN